MYKSFYALLTTVSLIFLGMTSCSKSSSDPDATPGPALNATETQLVGRWQLKETRDTMTNYSNGAVDYIYPTLRNDYDLSYYLELRSSATGVWLTQYPMGKDCFNAMGGMVTSNGWWYYDVTSARLNITMNYEILTLNTNNLKIRFKSGSLANGSGTIQVHEYSFIK